MPARLTWQRGREVGRARGRGVSVIYFLVILCVFAGVATITADYGALAVANVELRRAVDAACLAGSSGLTVSPTEARTRAKTFALANKVNGAGLVLLDSDIELGTWDSTTKAFTLLTGSNESSATAIRVTGRLSAARGTAVKLTWAPLIKGGSIAELATAAISGTDASTADVVIAQDNSTSFVQELPQAKTGTVALLDSLNANGGSSAFGEVKFAGSAQTVISLRPIAGNYTTLKSAINGVQVVNPGNGTDPASGIEQAITLFNTYGRTKPTSSRALIMISDGAPTSSVVTAHRWMSASQLLAQAQQDANTAWTQYQIHIYVVFMDTSNDTVGANNLKTLIRGNGVFVYVTDPTKLPAALSSITQMLPKGLVK